MSIRESYLEYFSFHCRRIRRLSTITAIFIVVHLNLSHFSLCSVICDRGFFCVCVCWSCEIGHGNGCALRFNYLLNSFQTSSEFHERFKQQKGPIRTRSNHIINGLQAWENACERNTIGLEFTAHCLRKWRKFLVTNERAK